MENKKKKNEKFLNEFYKFSGKIGIYFLWKKQNRLYYFIIYYTELSFLIKKKWFQIRSH